MRAHSLLFTDIVDSTAIAQRLGDERASVLWAEHDREARALMHRHGGREIDRTDGFFLLFDAVADAAAFALAYHPMLAALKLHARVGLHHASVVLRQNLDDAVARGAKPLEVEGLAKAQAARVMSLARGGQTLLTVEARQALGQPPAGCEIASIGHYRLKGITDPIELFDLAPVGASLEPPADGEKVYRVVRYSDGSGELWQPLRKVPHNLAPERDSFVGRSAELRLLARRLDGGVRLLTLMGVGGTGKTRLAQRYARAWLGQWPGGVYFCDLSEARGLDGIHFAVASALSVQLLRGDPGLQIGHAIAARGQCLIVLDNFEQVVSLAAATVGAWLDRAGLATFVVTSRERLQLAGEEVFALEPLQVDSEAVELFEVRAKAQRASFELDSVQRPAVLNIARLLDGLPLALELAAARVRVMSPTQICERLSQRFALLAGAKGVAARQATLKAAIDWSWELLSVWEQAALAQCSVFEGGFTLEAAEAVIEISRPDFANGPSMKTWQDLAPTNPVESPPPVMDLVQSLVDKSLLRVWAPAGPDRLDIAEPLFGMYLTIHEYVANKLALMPVALRTRAERRHSGYYARHGSDDALEALVRHGGIKRRQALALELDNLMAACRRSLSREDHAEAVGAYRAAWEVLLLKGPVGAGVAMGDQVLALQDLPDGMWLDAASCRADALFRAGRLDECEAQLVDVLARSRRLGDGRREGIALAQTATVLRDKGRLVEAQPLYEAAARCGHEAGNLAGEASALHSLGNTLDMLGRPLPSRAAHEAALALHLHMGNRHGVGHVHASIGILDRHTGRLREAIEQYEAALVVFREVGDRRSEGNTIGNMANVLEDLGRDDEQLQCLLLALEIHRQAGSRLIEGIVLGNLGLMRRKQGRLAEAHENLTQALSIHRDSGSRVHQGVVLGGLAGLAKTEGRVDQARKLYDEALALHRETNNRLYIGMESQGLGELLLDTGAHLQAMETLREGEAHLRAIDNPTELIVLLSLLGRAWLQLGDETAAQEVLAEMEIMLQRLGAGPHTRPGREVQSLRARLG